MLGIGHGQNIDGGVGLTIALVVDLTFEIGLCRQIGRAVNKYNTIVEGVQAAIDHDEIATIGELAIRDDLNVAHTCLNDMIGR